MTRHDDDLDFDSIREPYGIDEIGTVRVGQCLGSVAIYIKIAEDTWHPVYVDPARGQHLIPTTTLSDVAAGWHPIVFSPTAIGEQNG